jgi:hypothetical protein
MADASISLGAINIEADEPLELASFWAAVTGATPVVGGDSVFVPAIGAAGFAMYFQPMLGLRPERQSFHLDLTVPWGTRASEVERIIGLGASYRWEVLDEVPHVQWTTLADPEGNLFCVAEHPPRSTAAAAHEPAAERRF